MPSGNKLLGTNWPGRTMAHIHLNSCAAPKCHSAAALLFDTYAIETRYQSIWDVAIFCPMKTRWIVGRRQGLWEGVSPATRTVVRVYRAKAWCTVCSIAHV